MAPRIESYDFGRIMIDGQKYVSDVIILPDGVRPDWYRKAGHSLVPEDFGDLLDEVRPDKLIIGRGANGVLRVPDSTRAWLTDKGIELLDLPTKEACENYNRLRKNSRVIAGLHLTC